MSFAWVLFLAALSCRLEGQSADILSENTGQLNVQMALDRSVYFPDEAAALNITVTNPTSRPLQVMQPFSNDTGCVALFIEPPGGPPREYGADTLCNVFYNPLDAIGTPPEAIPTTVMTPGQKASITLDSYSPAFGQDFFIPSDPGSYSLRYYAYSLAKAPFTVVAPHLYASGEVRMADESAIDETTGRVETFASYTMLLALRYDGVSYICASVSPMSSTTVAVDRLGNLSGRNGPYRRIAESRNPVMSVSGTTDGNGNLTIQWRDSTGAVFSGSFTSRYDLVTDSRPFDGGGAVISIGGGSFNPGATAKLIAVPQFGYSFVNWTGAPVANPAAASTSITMSNGFSVIANFGRTGKTMPTNITAQLASTVSAATYDSDARQYLESITFTNTSGQYIGGPVSLVLTNLRGGFSLTEKTGTYKGSPYVEVMRLGWLAPGQSYTAFLKFSGRPTAVRFMPVFYAGLPPVARLSPTATADLPGR